MFFKKNTNIIYFLITLIVIVFFFLKLYNNIDHFPIPNGDLFQYIYDGQQYINFKLPSSIHPPPFVPFLICLVAKIFKQVRYPELFSAYVVNFLASILILLNIFLLLKKKTPLIALVTVFLLATNKIYFLTSIDLTNEIIYSFFLTLILLLYQKKYYKTVYLLSGLLFLVRYESIVVQFSIFIVEFFYNKKQFKIKNVLISFIPVVFWLIILNFHSSGTNILQNIYIEEISSGIKNIPNTNVFKSLSDVILFNPLISLTYPLFGENKYNMFFSNCVYYIVPIIIFLLFLITFFKKKNTNIKRVIYLILVLHLLCVTLFPQFCIRYLAPIIWMIYLLIIDRSNNKLKLLVVIPLVIFNFSRINQISTYNSPDGFGYKYTIDWINEQNFNIPTKILIYDPSIITYYINDKNVTLDFNSYESYNTTDNIYSQCQDNMTCVVEKLYHESSTESNIYVVTMAYSSQSEDNFPDKEAIKMHHMAAFRNFPSLEEKNNYKLIDTLGNQQYWAKIYQYIPSKTP